LSVLYDWHDLDDQSHVKFKTVNSGGWNTLTAIPTGTAARTGDVAVLGGVGHLGEECALLRRVLPQVRDALIGVAGRSDRVQPRIARHDPIDGGLQIEQRMPRHRRRCVDLVAIAFAKFPPSPDGVVHARRTPPAGQSRS
jgi:hypothetical protein